MPGAFAHHAVAWHPLPSERPTDRAEAEMCNVVLGSSSSLGALRPIVFSNCGAGRNWMKQLMIPTHEAPGLPCNCARRNLLTSPA